MKNSIPGMGDALLVVDVQNDFLPGGSLAVPHGDEVVAPLNRCLALFAGLQLPVYASRDWHPADHCSFRAQGGPWPPHCIAGTPGADFAAALQLPATACIVSKADSPGKDAYSAFDGTDLQRRLQTDGVRRLYVGGLATDYCVLSTVKDALQLGYRVVLLGDAIRAVEVVPGDGERAVAEMRGLGAQPALAAELAP
ncbi:MAG: isochorismatase family protein [Sideroxyarcus sp.]|nr:isochorismatase family protein [Sideroxyarcus sp.]